MSDQYPALPAYGNPYLPPTYPNHYPQVDDSHQAHYDASQAAYGYNGAVPSFSAAAVTSGVPPLPIFQGWNQDSTPLPPYNAAANQAAYAGFNNSAYTSNAQQNARFYPPPPQPSYHQLAPGVRPYEQGEMSEGELDENARSANDSLRVHGTPPYQKNGASGYTDTAQRAVYSRPKDYTPGDQYHFPSREISKTRLQPPSSYSPHVPSAGADHENPSRSEVYSQTQYGRSHDKTTGSSPTSRKSKGSRRASNEKVPIGSGNTIRQTTHRADELHTPFNTDVTSTSGEVAGHQSRHSEAENSSANRKVISDPEHIPSQGSSPTNGYHALAKADNTIDTINDALPRSVADNRKKAQGAILNLWPYDVRYQTYIDEGFDREIIESLFDELKMNKNVLTNAINPGEKMGSQTKENQALVDTPRDVPVVAKAAVLTEKEKTLQSKLEALRKSREERAQKAAAKNVNKTAIVPTSSTASLPKAATTAQATLPSISISSSLSTFPSDSTLPSTLALPSASTLSSTLNLPSNSPSTSRSPPTSILPTTSTSTLRSQLSLQLDAPTSSTPAAQQQTSIIPGLFLASPAANNPPATTMPPLSHNSLGKRPVAADFDKPTPSAAPYKRPFGQSRTDHTLVINVSEDEDSEDEDTAMDLESQGDQDSPTVPLTRMFADRSATNPILSSRQPHTSPPNSSAVNTPPVHAANYTAGIQDLGRVENELKELKKKIENAERRLEAKQNSGAHHVPNASELSTTTASPVLNKVETSVEIQKKAEIADTKIALEQQKVADAKAAESAEAEVVKKKEAEQRRLQRERIAADLPRADAALLESQLKLEQIRAQLAEAEAEHQRELKEKCRLDEEMKRLGEEAEEQLQAEKAKLTQLDKEVAANSEGPSHLSSVGTAAPSVEAIQTSHHRQSSSAPSTASSSVVQPPELAAAPAITESQSTAIDGLPATLGHPPTATLQLAEQDHTTHQAHENVVDVSHEKQDGSEDVISPGEAPEPVDHDMDAVSQDVEDMDIDDFYAPDSDQLAPKSASHPKDEEMHSPEYSPKLDRTVQEAPDRESDDYEPREAVPPSADNEEPYSPPFSPAQPQVTGLGPGPVPIASSAPPFPHISDPVLPETSNTTRSDDVLGDVSAEVKIANAPENNAAQVVTNDVRGSEAKVLDRSVLPQASKLVEDSAESRNKLDSYVPYESPLKLFAAYRFHPNFKQDVPGGLRSNTYSHKIKPNQEFCRWELSGGICNDPTCEEQHFREINLPDDAILTALGSPAEFKGEQRDSFCAGLRGVLLDLRVRKIRDFDIIATEIIAYRAKFLGDKSKVLAALEGTTI